MEDKIKQAVADAIQIHCSLDHRPEDAQRLKQMEDKIDRLLEVYTAANFVRKFIIGLIGFLGVMTGLIYSWVKLFKEFK